MTLSTASGLLAAVATIQPFFAMNGVTAAVGIGWRKRAQQVNQGAGGANRVLFSPSNDGGDGGTLGPPHLVGNRSMRPGPGLLPQATIRELASWERKVIVSVWAVDPSDHSDEAKQIAATEALLEWTVRAVHSAPGAFAEARWGGVKWTVPAERSFGLEALVGLTFIQPIFDVPRVLVFPRSGAVARGPHITPPTDSGNGDT